MSMVNCKGCGREISSHAETCPHCGEPQKPKGMGCLSWTISIVLLLLIFLVVFGRCSVPSSKTSYTPSSSPSSAYSPSVPPLEVLSFRCDREYSHMFVRGEVKNISSRAIKNLMAIGNFRKSDGTLVKSEDTLIDYNPLLPGQTSPYEVITTYNLATKRCNVEFKTMFGGRLDYRTAEGRTKKAQRLLSSLGYNVGVVDGIAGKKTRAAIRKFQKERNLRVDGKITDELIKELERSGR